MYGKRPDCYEIPYFILQQRVDNNKEVKLCFLNREFSHFASIGRNAKSFDGFSTEDLVRFAKKVLDLLYEANENFILDGLVRVDLFKYKGE
jgi:hypothetical protein